MFCARKVRERNDDMKVKMKEDPYGYLALLPCAQRDDLRLALLARLVSMFRSAR